MTLSSMKNEIPENIRMGLIAKGEGATWDTAAKLAKTSRYEMQQWRSHPDADAIINTAFHLCLEEAYGVIANAAPSLSRRLVEIGLDPKTKAYAATPAIMGCMSILQEGVINRQNKLEMKKILCLLLIINISYKLSYSQNNSPLELNEAKALIEAYISPLGNSLGAGLNNGWYNSAKTHKTLGFDFTLTTNLVLINDNVKDFKFQDIIVGNAFNDTASSTILGNTDGTSFDVLGSNGTTYEVTLPSGENIPVIIVPMLQAGIGIGKSTDLNLRYLPSLHFGRAGRVGVLGGWIKHYLMQWIPFLEKLYVNLAFQG